MKVHIRDEIFGNSLGNIIATGSIKEHHKAGLVSEKKFAPNLYKISDKKVRDKKIKEYIKKLCEHSNPEDKRFGICQRLVKKIDKEVKSHSHTSNKVSKAIDEATKIFKTVHSSSKSHASSSYGKYPKEKCSIFDLKKHGDNKKEMKKLLHQIRQDTKKDPMLAKLYAKGKASKSKNHSTFANVENRISDLNASHVSMKGLGEFILAASPREDKKEIKKHAYHTLIDSPCSLWFTLNQTKKESRPKFWDHKSLSHLKHGWKIKSKDEKSVASAGSADLKRTDLLATDKKHKKEIRHFHYDGWKDHKTAPDDDILLKCAKTAYKHMKETKTAVGINCKGGVGRTGVLATVVAGIQHIQNELKKGKKLKDISINIPKIIYDFRKQRRGIVSHGPQLAQVYRLIGKYAKELK